MSKIACVILAAGQSTRMKSKLSKVLYPIAGRPAISYPIAAAKGIKAERVVVVRGPKQDDLKSYLNTIPVKQAVQKQTLGTAHAVSSASKALAGFDGYVLILCGDVPLIRSEVLAEFLETVATRQARAGVLTTTPSNPFGYGRIVRDLDDEVIRIVEEKDASEKERAICEINTGIICAQAPWLVKTLKKIDSCNAKGEFYLTDLIHMAVAEGSKVAGFHSAANDDFIGINTRVDLALVSKIMRERINTTLMLDGVGILDVANTFIDADVKIGQDTTIMPYTFISGASKIGIECTIENGVVIHNSVIGNGVHIKAHSVIEESIVLEGAVIGPFARLRPSTRIGARARVGNFVELKKCELKEGAKANHLSYLGDATIGRGANIGCGTITCNYDGVNKHKTVIGDDAFIGCDTQFIAPISVGRGAVIGAGSTITKNVPAESLAMSRVTQSTVKGWAKKRRKNKR